MQITPYEADDEAAVLAIWGRCGLLRHQNDPARDIRLKLEVHPELFLVARLAGRPVGTVMAGYEGHRGWINYLGVDPDHQRRGIGRALMTEAERLLRVRGCPKINLQVRESNAAVVAFYESIGFAKDPVVSLGKRVDCATATKSRGID